MNRLSLTESEKAKWVELYEDHDLSAAAFCREFSLPYTSFLKWRRERGGALAPSSATESASMPAAVEFVELVAEQPRTQSSHRSVLLAELELGAGHVLRVFRAENNKA